MDEFVDINHFPVCTSIKAVIEDGDERKLIVLGAPYGGPVGGKDLQGEYFSKRTDFVIEEGESRPAFYYHGDAERLPTPIGKATVTRRDHEGLWFEVVLNKAGKFADKIWDAAKRGIAKASSGTIAYLKRMAKDGEILTWPIAELTLLDVSINRRPSNSLARVALKAAFDDIGTEMPQAFTQAEEAKVNAAELEDKLNAETNKKIASTIFMVMAHLFGGKENGR